MQVAKTIILQDSKRADAADAARGIPNYLGTCRNFARWPDCMGWLQAGQHPPRQIPRKQFPAA